MIYFYFLIFLTVTIFLLKKDFFNPACITLFVWSVVEVIYQNVDHGLNKLSPLFFEITFFWCLCFSLGCLIVSNMNFKVNNSCCHFLDIDSCKMYTLLFAFLSFSIFFVILNAKATGLSPIGYVRNIGLNSDNVPLSVKIINLLTTLIYPCVFLFIESKVKRIKKLLIFLLFFILSILSGSKSAVIQIFITSFFLLFYHRKFKILLFIVMTSVLICAFVVITLFRDNGKSKVDFIELIYIYFLSPLPAFDLLINNKLSVNEYPVASTVLGLFYRVLSKITGSSVPDSGLGFVFVPVPTNVYTIMLTGYLDFGRYGMFFFSFFYGILWGIFYSFVKRNYKFYKILYACFLNVLCLQFFADYLFPYLAIFIYQILIIEFIYHKSKFTDFNYLRLKNT